MTVAPICIGLITQGVMMSVAEGEGRGRRHERRGQGRDAVLSVRDGVQVMVVVVSGRRHELRDDVVVTFGRRAHGHGSHGRRRSDGRGNGGAGVVIGRRRADLAVVRRRAGDGRWRSHQRNGRVRVEALGAGAERAGARR